MPNFIHTGALTGFSDIGDVNNHLVAFERSLSEDGAPSQPLAKSMLVLMVRGLFSGLQYILLYVQFPCCSLKADQMFRIVWAAVGRLEHYGFRVVVLTCNGLAANRQLFRLHGPNKSSKELQYKTENLFSKEARSVYFLSNPPHLLKTARNCLTNQKRHLWVCYKELMI